GVWNNLTRATSYLHSGLGRADLTIPLPFPLPTIPNPITPKAFIESVTTVFQTLFRLPLWEAAYAAQKLAVYVTSCTERKLGQWDQMTWEDYIGANKRSAEYNRYLRRDHSQPGGVEIQRSQRPFDRAGGRGVGLVDPVVRQRRRLQGL